MKDSQHKPSRRGFFIGAVTAGASAAAVSTLPLGAEVQQVSQAPQPKPEKGGGYRLSEHVKRYYKSTLI
ncbi:MAG: formate dehydrogenase [Burkholderiaceae bacterium]|nr:formate dehydrogenase [Burkholderiaceae bacterium]MDO9088901.1 formate dehydrogenase [Burkholderiaceae bacterium]